MTVTTLTNRITHIGDGTVVLFPYDFLVLAESHLFVYLDGVLTTIGFTINNDIGNSNGDVTFDVAPASGVVIVLLRTVPLTQEIDYTAFDAFPAETHEKGLDLGVMRDQQSSEGNDRALRVPIEDPPINDIPNVAGRAGRLLGFDSAGQPVPGSLLDDIVTKLDDLLDVDVSTVPPVETDALIYNATKGLFENKLPILSLDDLTSVTAPTPNENEVLKFVSGQWINAELPASLVFVGDFDPVLNTPVLDNTPTPVGTVAGETYIATDSGLYNFTTGLPGTGVQVNVNDQVAWSSKQLSWIVLATGSTLAVEVNYDNSSSGLAATDVQAAIDEVYSPVATGSTTARSLTERFVEPFNVRDYGATGDGVTDDTAAIEACLVAASDGKVVFPQGTYLCNVTSNRQVHVTGFGQEQTILSPFNEAIAVWTHKGQGFWNYSGRMENLWFKGITPLTGVGFTFSNTDPADWALNDEFENNVDFHNCYFSGFHKGWQAPAGNIGSAFYSCGFTSNYYAVYLLNSKFGGIMHESNKYYYNCHWTTNQVAYYSHAVGNTGGAHAFYSCIMELNEIAIWNYSSGTQHQPWTLNNMWFESNGQAQGTAMINVDQWTGTVLSTITPIQRTVIITGPSAQSFNFHGGHIEDISVEGFNVIVNVENAHFENGTDRNSTVDDVSSVIISRNTTHNSRATRTANTISLGNFQTTRPSLEDSGTQSGNRGTLRGMQALSRTTPITQVNAHTFESQTTLADGAISVTGTVVADGRILPNCNEYSVTNWTTSQFTRPDLLVTDFTAPTTFRFFVATFDAKTVAGQSPRFYVWNRSLLNAMQQFKIPEDGLWHTVMCMFTSPEGGAGGTMFFDLAGNNEDCTWRMGAWQLHSFGNRSDMVGFFEANTYYTGE